MEADLQTGKRKVVSITAGGSVVLEYVLKMIPVMKKPAATFVNKRNVEKPQAFLN